MPIEKYFRGHGDEVMENMEREYGEKKGKSVFYATANKRKMKPAGEQKAHRAGLSVLSRKKGRF